jgi:uncharacterized protein (TIGR03067 family)
MKNAFAACFVALTVAAGVAAQTQDAAPKELAPLQGTWNVTEVNGSAPQQQISLTITGAKYSETVDGTVDETGTIKVDNSKTPVTLDLLIAEGSSAGQTQLGIVEVKGDAMRCLLSAPGSGTRPSSFDKGDGDLFVVLQKKK